VTLTHRRVYSLAYRLVGDPHDAEDVAQDAYLRMFRALEGFREEARFETWMYRIVTNSAMNLLKRRGRFGVVVTDDVLDGPVPDRPVERLEDRDELARAMQTLPPAARTVIWLKDVYGLSCKEIGDELGIEEGAVKVRLHRARRRLKERLEATRDEVPAQRASVRGGPSPAPGRRGRRGEP